MGRKTARKPNKMTILQTGPLVRRFTRNPLGRDLIVGDVHGCFTKLQASLYAVGFDPVRDRLFSVGDLVDRGPESHQALDWLALPWFHAVSGNHEAAAIYFARGAIPAGFYMRGYGGGWNVGNPQEARDEYAAAFAALPVAMELETAAGLVGIVHADCPCPSWDDFTRALADEALSVAARVTLIMSAQENRGRADFLDRCDVAGVRAVVVGHTPMQDVTSLGNVLFIDTAAWKGGNDNPALFPLINAETLQACTPPRR